MTGGNPLLVTEVLAGSAEGVPATVRDLVLSRLSAMSAAAREVAGLVSVVPSQAEAALLGARAAAVDECLAHGVLVATADSLAFRHELLRRAVEESLSPVRRAALHAEVLAALAARPGVDPARLVHHAHHAGDAEAVLRWAPVAAGRASEVGAYRQAAAHYATALPFAAGFEPPELRRAAGGLRAGGLPRRADAGGARRAAAGAGPARGGRRRRADRRRPALGVPAELVERAAGRRPGGRPCARSRCWRRSRRDGTWPRRTATCPGCTCWATRTPRRSSGASGRSRLARRLGDVETEVNSLINIASARLHAAVTRRGSRSCTRRTRPAVAAGADDQAGRALVNLGSMAVDWADYRTAEDAMDRVLPFTIARDLDGYTRHLLGHRARLRLARGDWRAARADADQALTGPEQPGACLVPALTVARRDPVPAGRGRRRRGSGARRRAGVPDRGAAVRRAGRDRARRAPTGWPVIRTGPPPRRNAGWSWPRARSSRGSSGSWRTGCGAAGGWARRRRWRPRRTGC